MDEPLAYLLTWTTYGSWLPGDERGWVEKFGKFREPDAQRRSAARRRMVEAELVLSSVQRELVERTIADHCRIRDWELRAVNCRTQHVHVVVSAAEWSSDVVLNEFKIWCTRRLKDLQQTDRTPPRTKWWTQGGSKRPIYTQAGLERAIQYVMEGQDGSRTNSK